MIEKERILMDFRLASRPLPAAMRQDMWQLLCTDLPLCPGSTARRCKDSANRVLLCRQVRSHRTVERRLFPRSPLKDYSKDHERELFQPWFVYKVMESGNYAKGTTHSLRLVSEPCKPMLILFPAFTYFHMQLQKNRMV